MIDKAYKEIGNWTIKIGIHPVNIPPITCNEIANIDLKTLLLMELDSFEDFLNKLSSYNIYIKAQKGSIEAQIEILTGEINKQLYIQTSALGIDYKFKTIDEKIATVRTLMPEIDEQCIKLSILKAQYARIKDVPYAIDKKIDILRTIHQRRMNERPKH